MKRCYHCGKLILFPMRGVRVITWPIERYVFVHGRCVSEYYATVSQLMKDTEKGNKSEGKQ